MTCSIDLDRLRRAVASDVAIRRRCRLQPAGGPGDKVFPPTYPTGYAKETRRIDGREVPCVLLDSVQSQANRMEEALLSGWRRKELCFPVGVVSFAGTEVADIGDITTLEAPHRLADAILRDSLHEGLPFRVSEPGRALTEARITDATAVYRYCPTALVFGVWDSTSTKGVAGAKFERLVVSEIVGVGATLGVKTSSRIDPLQIEDVSKTFPLLDDGNGGWCLDPAEAASDEKGNAKRFKKEGKPSEANHGNVKPSVDAERGGVTIDYALDTVLLTLAGLRRLRFPARPAVDPGVQDARDLAARTALAALALAAIAYQDVAGFDLRSRCALVPEGSTLIEFVGADGSVEPFSFDPQGARALLEAAGSAAAVAGVGWGTLPGEPAFRLTPSPKLVSLIALSRSQATPQSAS